MLENVKFIKLKNSIGYCAAIIIEVILAGLRLGDRQLSSLMYALRKSVERVTYMHILTHMLKSIK
jgi:urease gamma subunit